MFAGAAVIRTLVTGPEQRQEVMSGKSVDTNLFITEDEASLTFWMVSLSEASAAESDKLTEAWDESIGPAKGGTIAPDGALEV